MFKDVLDTGSYRTTFTMPPRDRETAGLTLMALSDLIF